MGIELEFYAEGIEEFNQFLDGIPYNLNQEKGQNQLEIDLLPEKDPIKVLNNIQLVKSDIETLARRYGGEALFGPKPFAHSYGNAVHFHVNLVDKSFNNLFDDVAKRDLVASAMCDDLASNMVFFAPTPECYTRFDKNFIAPTHICHGNNNRTAAIRTPNALPQRLEHRICSMNSDLYMSLYSIINSIYKVLTNPEKVTMHNKIYGNAFEEHYQLDPLPQSLEESYDLYLKRE